MKSKRCVVAVVMLMSLWLAGVAAAGPLEDAKAALDQKQYDQVDVILEKDLKARQPSAESLRLSLAAAEAQGHLLTAHKRINALLKAIDNNDLDMVYRSAEIAERIGDPLALTRYLTYAQRVNDKTPKLQAALEYVLQRGGYVAEYKKYVTLFGATPVAWDLGAGIMGRLIEAADAAKLLEMGEFLIQTFPAPPNVYVVHGWLRNAADSFVFGKEPRDRYHAPLMVMMKGTPTGMEHIDHMTGQNDQAWPNVEQRVKLCMEYAKRATAPAPWNILSRIQHARDLEDLDARLAVGRDYLSIEPIYLNAENPDAYETYLRAMVETPQVFNIPDKVLLTPADAIKKLDALKKKYEPWQITRCSSVLQNISVHFLGSQPEARVAFLRSNISWIAREQIADLLALSDAAKNYESIMAEVSKGRCYRDMVDIRSYTMNYAASTQNKALITRVARDHMMMSPADWSREWIQAHFINLPEEVVTADEKLALLNEMIALAGISPSMKALAAEMVKVKEWAENPTFKELQEKIKANPAGSDLLASTIVVMANLPRNPGNPPKELEAAVDKFFAEYKGTYPGSQEEATDLQGVLVAKIYNQQWQWSHQNRPAVGRLVAKWSEKLPVGGIMEGLALTFQQWNWWAEMYPLAKRYVVATKEKNIPGNPSVWWWLSNTQYPRDEFTPLFTDAYGRMPANAVFNYFYNQRGQFERRRQVLADECAKLLATPGQQITDMNALQNWTSQMWHWSGQQSAENGFKLPLAAIKALWDSYVKITADTGRVNYDVEMHIYGLYVRCGYEKEAAEFLTKTYSTFLKQRPLLQQIEAVTQIFRHMSFPYDPRAKQGDAEVETITDGYRRGMVFNVLIPMLKQVPPAEYSKVTIHNNFFEPINGLLGYKQDPDLQGKAWEAARFVATVMGGGARSEVAPSYWFAVMGQLCAEAIEKEDWNELNRLTDLYASLVVNEGDWNNMLNNYIGPLLKAMEAKKAYESIFVFMVSLERRSNPRPEAARQLVMLKSRASTYIPEMIAVGPEDPTYDLHMAAQALMLGNDLRAWELTEPKLCMMPDVWETLEPSYVVWVIGKMRNNKQYKEALDFCFKVLLSEAKLDPAIAAGVLLTKGDIYLGMENYQAARIEFEGLRANAAYAKTPSGAQAIYRLVELHIKTKNYPTAQQMLDRMVDADSLEMQAEAYFWLAKMKYDRGEYSEAADDVKQAKERVMNHVEATLLEAEINLARKKIYNPEVPIGDRVLSTVAIPGKPLVLQIQDSNLSVARAGKDIPVLVTTSSGDRERVSMHADRETKNLFIGTINTTLGKATPGNLVLELKGDDTINYIIDPEFQEANNINYSAKPMWVRSNARLTASAGEILTEEEEERRELERQLNRRRIIGSRQDEISRDGRTVRPGSSIYVQVIDPDRSLTDNPDTVTVNVRTSSGSFLENVKLTETGPYTGMFRGAIPTAVPLPKASASDTEEGKTPASMILKQRTADWTSQADGRKPKWVEVDTMSSCDVSSIQLLIPQLANIREISVQGLLADEYEELATFPVRTDEAKGGLILDIAPEQQGGGFEQIKRHLRLAGNTSQPQPDPSFTRDTTYRKGGDGWMTTRLRGMFHHDGGTLELKFMQATSPNNWQYAYLVIDGQVVLGGNINNNTIGATGRAELAKGVHTMEIYVMDHWRSSTAVVGYRKDDGTFEPISADWFDPAKRPALKEALESRATLTIKGDTLSVDLPAAKRLRKVRVNFNDFTGQSVSVREFMIKDAKGKVIVPGNEDFTKGLNNTALQVAPGDEIYVSYLDEQRVEGPEKLLTANLNASYYNGTIMLADEVILQDPNNPTSRWLQYQPAKRCRPGDQLMIVVTDFDCDTTEERDTVDVLVTTSSGEKLELKAWEFWPNGDEEMHKHAGVFVAILKIGNQTGKDTIKVNDNDQVKVSYMDMENTKPGVPIERSYTVMSAERADPAFLVYNTNITMVPDNSLEARNRVARLAGGRDTKDVVMFRPQIVASHPQYSRNGEAPAARPSGRDVTVSVGAPLLFEVTYPRVCLNLGSQLEVTAVAESEIRNAQKEGREPKELIVPMQVMGMERLAYIKGYPLQIQAFQYQRRNDQEMLRDGAFSGVIRLQVGAATDIVDDLVVTGEKEFASLEQRAGDQQGFYFRVPTLLISGNDAVILKVKNVDTGKVTQQRINLLSDAYMELLDKTYMVQTEAIHLGDKFYVRVTDPDMDISDKQDTVKVTATSSSGSKVTMVLTETLSHSGVFTGSIKPEFKGAASASQPAGEAVAKAADDPDTLYVNFGDKILFEYVDERSVTSPTKPVTVSRQARIHYGSDGELATFTKRFKDPEIAVKTRFLMAEALFEMAKEHRKLGQKKVAEDEISRGKFILEEAMRDFPETTLAVQGEYLLANLAQELGADEPVFYTEAINRYAHLLSTYPDSEYAAPSQFKMALCYERKGEFDQACEEYVKLTYIYPDSSFVAEATVRLGNYYYKNQKYNIAAKIFLNFQQRNPQHKLAAQSMFIAAQCYYRQADWPECVRIFEEVTKEYPHEKDVRAEALYWLGDAWVKCATDRGDPEGYKNAYQAFKKLTWEYPESKWAKHARGRLTDTSFTRLEEEGT